MILLLLLSKTKLEKNNIVNCLEKLSSGEVFLAEYSENLRKIELLFLVNMSDEKDGSCIQQFFLKMFPKAKLILFYRNHLFEEI
jgi:hypothetical protein